MVPRFSLFITSVISIFVFLAFPSGIRAVELGTHVAHFDRGAEIGVLGLIRSKLSKQDGYPVTINIDPQWSTAEIQELADKAEGFRVALRIISVSSKATPEEMQTLVQQLNGVRWKTTGKPVVVLGNELNNLVDEWKSIAVSVEAAGAAYTPLHDVIWSGSPKLDMGRYDLAAATIDPYHPNNWKLFVSGAGRAYTQHNTIFVANIYENSAEDTKKRIEEIKSGISGVPSKTILTEYGPKDPKSPLAEYMRFYKENAPPSNVEYATALLANYCKKDKAVFGYFYYIEGKVYTIDGDEVDPQTCLGAKSLTDESKTPDDEVDGIYVYKDIYKNVLLNGEKGGKESASRYVMMCAPQFWTDAEIQDQDKKIYWEKLGDKAKTLSEYCTSEIGSNTNEPNCVFDPVTANFTVINDNLTVPLYRKATFNDKGQQMDNNRAESIESFFGTNTKEGRKTGDPLLYSPNVKLLSKAQYCTQTVRYLKAIEMMCQEPQAQQSTTDKEIVPRGKCTLNNEFENSRKQKVRYLDILKQVKDNAAAQGLQTPEDYCDLVVKKQDPNLMKDLAQVQPLTKNAFKIGYLVYYNTGRYKKDSNDPEDKAAFQDSSEYFHPVYRTLRDYYANVTFQVIPFLVPANVFSTSSQEDVVGNSFASFDSPYTTVFQTLMPQAKINQLAESEQKRRVMIESQLDQPWNAFNDASQEKPYIQCPVCDDSYNKRGYVPSVGSLAANKTYLAFAKTIWRRINAGIYTKEFVQNLDVKQGNELVAQPPDIWNSCNVAPELVRGESAQALHSQGGISLIKDGKETLWGKVKQSATEITSLIRAPKGTRRDPYEYYVRGYLLLPQEYGYLLSTEQDFLRALIPYSAQKNILETEQKKNDFNAFGNIAGLDPSKADYDKQVPLWNRFLRLNGQVFGLNDLTADSTGKHGKDGNPDTYYTESKDEYEARVAKARQDCANRGILPRDCSIPERKKTEITAKQTSQNPGYKEGKTDFRPILPGGWLARGIFELMAHITSSKGSANFQDKYCGLEDYLLGTNCAGAGSTSSIKNTTTSSTKGDIACINVWVDEATAQAHAQDILASLPSRADWGKYFSGYLSDPVRQCKDPTTNPSPSEYDSVAKQYLFESVPECGGVSCYSYIVQRTLSAKTSDGKVVDPYIAISIALNENGGLKTARKDRMSQHFGVVTPITGHSKECPEDNEYMGRIDEKLDIMLQTLIAGYKGKDTLGADGVAALERYKSGSNARPLEDQTYSQKMIQLTQIISGNAYSPLCTGKTL
ncbi:MAG: hypothetical protein HZA34_03035 [Candidatus Pacebacteria bacterium]|nr:hypothetical protein [Candidatus Paceibacterota bacterium]